MNHWLKTRVLLVCLFSIGSAGIAAAGRPLHRSPCQTCPQCHTCCELKVEKVEEDRHCWDIECKEICIPRVVFPWQKSHCNPCVNNGAYVKTVRVLKKHDYTCPACEYTWTPKEPVCQPVVACPPACGCAQCCSAPTGIDMGLTPLSDAPAVPTPPTAEPVRIETVPQAY